MTDTNGNQSVQLGLIKGKLDCPCCIENDIDQFIFVFWVCLYKRSLLCLLQTIF